MKSKIGLILAGIYSVAMAGVVVYAFLCQGGFCSLSLFFLAMPWLFLPKSFLPTSLLQTLVGSFIVNLVLIYAIGYLLELYYKKLRN